MQQYQGNISKLISELQTPVQYHLPVGDHRVALNPLLGQELHLHFNGVINCIACGRETKKSFNQGYCFVCMRRLAACDQCIVRPELCHFAAGTCREPEWGLAHCMQAHVVYLANSSGVKVGITRQTQVPTRWIDQGAVQALPIFRVQSRLQSGILEVALKKYISDKTNWRTMLAGDVTAVDLWQARDQLLNEAAEGILQFQQHFSLPDLDMLNEDSIIDITYPVLNYPKKINSLNLDKTPDIRGELLGIKGQYIILSSGVLNVRKYAGYFLTLSVDSQST